METELQRAKGGNEDKEDEIDGHIANALSHASGRHVDLEMGKLFVCEHIPKHDRNCSYRRRGPLQSGRRLRESGSGHRRFPRQPPKLCNVI